MIHPQAIVDPTAKLADDVVVGPWTIIGPDVEIDAGSKIESHVVLKGPTKIGKNNHIFQFSSVGEDTPDLKYDGEPTRLVIGDNNVIREGVTIHRGTVQDRHETTIGDNNLLMAYAHVGHDCVLGNNIILVNNVALAGHVHVDDWAILGGYSGVHQFCRIGAHSFTGMYTSLTKDLPAYVTAFGTPGEAKTINAEGLRRRGFSKEAIAEINRAFKTVYRRGLTLEDAKKQLAELAEKEPAVQVMLDSLNASQRGITR
ncbi:MAG: acyl-ACP--UDP-N-acetylglucosamine O-acyltransferase [Cellvibrionaceae bacterium]